MDKVITFKEAIKLSKKLKSEKKRIVLVGGCFDILHIGHVTFLKKAKERADVLLVLLESDEAVKELKGANRPINTQKDRAWVLASLCGVDYVIILPKRFNDKMYDELIIKIRPDILATTRGDSQRHHKERQAKLVGAKVIEIIEPLKNQSTTRLAELLKEEYGL